MQYITYWRMNLALAWLKKEDVSLDELANLLDYKSEVVFSRAFKRIIGVLPGAARRNGSVLSVSMRERV